MADFTPKDLDKLLEKMSKMDASPDRGDMSNAKEFVALEKAVQDVEKNITAETEVLKEDAAHNKVANNLQIAKEVLTFTSERKARKEAHTAVKKTDEALKYLKDETDATKKHNRRAAQSRRFIEKQNKGILAILEKKNFGGGTGGGGAGGSGGSGGGSGGGGGGSTPLEAANDAVFTEQTAYQMTPEQAAARKRAEAQFRDKGDTDKDPKGEISTDVKMSEAGKVIEDTDTGEMRESTAGTFNKGAAKDFFSDEAVKTNKKNMRKLRVGGKGLVRAETTRKGGIDFRHESDPEKEGLGGGGGKYADAIAYEDSERRIDQLAGNIKAGMGYAGGTRDRNESMQSKAKASMSAALKDNAGDIQIALDAASDEDKKEYQKLQEMLAKTGTEDAVSTDELRKQTAKVNVSMGDDFSKMAGIDKAEDDLYSERSKSFLGVPLNKTGLKDFAGVDSGSSFKEGLAQAFSTERLFGKKSNLTTKAGLKRAAQEEAKQELGIEAQEEGLRGALGKEGLGVSEIKSPKEKRIKDLSPKRQKELDDVDEQVKRAIGEDRSNDPVAATVAQPIEDSVEEVAEVIKENQEDSQPAIEAIKEATDGEGLTGITTENVDRIIEKIDEVINAISGQPVKGKQPVKERSGIDKESIGQQQLEVLEEIRDALSGGGEEGGEGGGGLMGMAGDYLMGRNKKGKKGKKGRKGKMRGGKRGMLSKLAKGGGRMLGGLGKAAGGLARAIPGVGLAVAAGSALFGGFKGARNAGETFGLEGDEKATIGQKIAGGVGGAISGLTFGLVDGKKAAQFFGGKDHRAELRKLQETDPEAAARVQASIDAGVDPDKALANEGVDTQSGLMKTLTAPAKLIGKAVGKVGGAVMDMFKSDETKARDKARDEAKDSGLYDRNWLGKSTIDSSKLGEASIEQLEAILHDDDLSEEDKEKVQAALDEKKMAKEQMLTDAGLETPGAETGEAIETVTTADGAQIEAAGDAVEVAQAGPAPVAVTNNNVAGGDGGQQAPVTAILAGGLRSSDSTIQRYQDKRFVI